MRKLLAALALLPVLAACGSNGSSASASPQDVMTSQHLAGCTEEQHSDLELFVTRGWKCGGGHYFLWFGTSDAEANWKKAAGQFGWAGKSGNGWAIEDD